MNDITKKIDLALWLVDHQMNIKVSEEFGAYFARIPLVHSATIVHGNALQLDWGEVLPAATCSYLLGNPPFAGKSLQNTAQKFDMAAVTADIPSAGLWIMLLPGTSKPRATWPAIRPFAPLSYPPTASPRASRLARCGAGCSATASRFISPIARFHGITRGVARLPCIALSSALAWATWLRKPSLKQWPWSASL